MLLITRKFGTVLHSCVHHKYANYIPEESAIKPKFDRPMIITDDFGILVQMKRFFLITLIIAAMVTTSCGQRHAGGKNPKDCKCNQF